MIKTLLTHNPQKWSFPFICLIVRSTFSCCSITDKIMLLAKLTLNFYWHLKNFSFLHLIHLCFFSVCFCWFVWVFCLFIVFVCFVFVFPLNYSSLKEKHFHLHFLNWCSHIKELFKRISGIGISTLIVSVYNKCWEPVSFKTNGRQTVVSCAFSMVSLISLEK